MSQNWTVYDGDNTLAYSTKYTIHDNTGTLCLGLTAPVGTEMWSAIDVETCTGGVEQKWNALSNPGQSALEEHPGEVARRSFLTPAHVVDGLTGKRSPRHRAALCVR